MSRAAFVGLVALAGATLVRGDDAPSTSTTVPERAPLGQETFAEGALPDLEGRWFLLTTVGIGPTPKRTLVSTLEIVRKDGALRVDERHVVLPSELASALQRANDELAGAWEPTPGDLDVIAAAFDTMAVEDRGIAQINHLLNARDAYDDSMRTDGLTKDALWVYRQQYVFEPGGNRPTNQANLLATLRSEGGVYAGTYVALAVAAAPFPVPIRFDGAFRLIPLARPAPSFWSRLGDLFAGCNPRR